MSAVILPNGRHATTPIGFGCAYLAGGFEKRRNMTLVRAAYDAGTRHFDVAPSYGVGQAEEVLSEAIGANRQRSTIATKAGILRPHVRPAQLLIRALAAPIKRMLPQSVRKAGLKAISGTAVPPRHFDTAFVKASLEESLRRLRTDYIDLFLLHEVRAGDITDDLLTFLDKRRRDGVTLAIGIASEYENALEIAELYGTVFDVFQYSWSVLDNANHRPAGAKFVITHRAVARAFETLGRRIATDSSVRARLSDAAQLDLSDERILSSVLIGAARAANRDGIVLIASRQSSRVIGNALAGADDKFIEAGNRLIQALSVDPQFGTSA